MNTQEIEALLAQVEFENYSFNVFDQEGHMYLQASYPEADIVTNVVEIQKTRKWLLSPFMTKSEIVQTAFKCCITSMEHRTREAFKYRGKRIFGPHFDVDALWWMCKDGEFDVRAAA